MFSDNVQRFPLSGLLVLHLLSLRWLSIIGYIWFGYQQNGEHECERRRSRYSCQRQRGRWRLKRRKRELREKAANWIRQLVFHGQRAGHEV